MSVRKLGVVILGCLVLVGLVRAAGGDAAVAQLAAQARLVEAAHAAGLAMTAADPTPVVNLQKVLVLTPGANGEILASGTFPAGATFRLKGKSLSITKEAVAGNQYRATVAAAADALPGKAYLEVATASGRRAAAEAVVVGGKWQVEATAANGWRVKMTPVTKASAQPHEIFMKAEFFRGSETAPFEVRNAKLYLPDPERDTYSIQFEEATQDDDCASVTDQMASIGQRFATATSPAEQEKVMKDMERIQGRMEACTEKQMKQAEALIANAQNPAYQQAQREKDDNFGCRNLTFQPATAGAIQGNLTCGKNVRDQKVTGTITFSGV
jgi:hypothetical protein